MLILDVVLVLVGFLCLKGSDWNSGHDAKALGLDYFPVFMNFCKLYEFFKQLLTFPWQKVDISFK